MDGMQTVFKSGIYFDSAWEIVRNIFIGMVLYTISEDKIKANSLLDLTQIATVILS
jgi:hypothetical protein